MSDRLIPTVRDRNPDFKKEGELLNWKDPSAGQDHSGWVLTMASWVKMEKGRWGRVEEQKENSSSTAASCNICCVIGMKCFVQCVVTFERAENKCRSVPLRSSSGDEANNIYGRLAHLAS